jgi:hypothetical protein
LASARAAGEALHRALRPARLVRWRSALAGTAGVLLLGVSAAWWLSIRAETGKPSSLPQVPDVKTPDAAIAQANTDAGDQPSTTPSKQPTVEKTLQTIGAGKFGTAGKLGTISKAKAQQAEKKRAKPKAWPKLKGGKDWPEDLK